MPSRKDVLHLAKALALPVLILAGATGGTRTHAATPQPSQPFSQPLFFEPNVGQDGRQVQYIGQGAGYHVSLTAEGATLEFGNGRQRAPQAAEAVRHTLQLRFKGANLQAKSSGMQRLPGVSHYLTHRDPAKRQTNVPNYEKVRYQQVYPGIDLVYYGRGNQLEYDLVVAPGADPSPIQLQFQGADRLSIAENGDLLVDTDGTPTRFSRPLVYQEIHQTRREIPGRYVCVGQDGVRFEIGSYDKSRALVIDPLAYSTYLGSANDDAAYGIANDNSGNVYVCGESNFNAFVAKYNSSGVRQWYTTLGSGSASGIAVNPQFGNIYVTGSTFSNTFPTTGTAYDTTHNGSSDCFVGELATSGSSFTYCTFLGGTDYDVSQSIALDNGNVYITGSTLSSNFPVKNQVYGYSAGFDGFVAKVLTTSSGASSLVYSTCVGGTDDDFPFDISVQSGAAYITGVTYSNNYPTSSGAYDTALGGGTDAFVTKFSSTPTLSYSTYLGGTSGDSGSGIITDAAGNAYVTGDTSSTNYPTASAAQGTHGGGFADGFVTKLNSTGTGLGWSTFLGGSDTDRGYAIGLASAGGVYVTGQTFSSNFPTTALAYDTSYNGNGDVFLTTYNSAGATLSSSYLGGSQDELGHDLSVDQFVGYAFIAGYTRSTNFPTQSPHQASNAGNSDAFVTKIFP